MIRAIATVMWVIVGLTIAAAVPVEIGVVIVFLLGGILWAKCDNEARDLWGPLDRMGG